MLIFIKKILSLSKFFFKKPQVPHNINIFSNYKKMFPLPLNAKIFLYFISISRHEEYSLNYVIQAYIIHCREKKSHK